MRSYLVPILTLSLLVAGSLPLTAMQHVNEVTMQNSTDQTTGSSSSDSAAISVDALKTIRVVNPRMFGINTAVWDSNLDTPWTIRHLKEMGVGILRFPGGSASDGYNWQTNKQDANTYTWATNFDQFAHVAKSIGAQAMITVNYGSGTAEEAANWVRYSNITKGYGFKYWEVGNEVYGGWEEDHHAIPHDPYTYATEAVKYIHAMKAVDPSIKIGVVVETGQNGYANNQNHSAINPVTGHKHYGWTPVVLSTMLSLHTLPDFLIYHRYEQGPGKESDAGLLQAAKTWKNDVADLEKIKHDYLGNQGRKVQIVCTENNSVYSNTGKQTTSVVNALYLDDSLCNVLKTPLQAFIWWDLRNGPDPNNNNSPSLYGWRQYGDYGVMDGQTVLYPTFYAFEMLTHFARGGDKIVQAKSDNSLVSCFACRQKSGDLALLLLNKSPDATESANFDISGYSPASAASLYSYGIPQDDAAKNGVGDQKIAQTAFSGAAKSFSLSIAPYSITVLVLHHK